MSSYKYKSILAPYISKLLDLKKSAGVDLVSISYTLRTFDNYLCKINQEDPHLDSKFFIKWHSSLLNDSPGTIRNKFSVWRQLTSLMRRYGCICYIPEIPKNLKSDFSPYIYTKEQIHSIFLTCDKLALQSHNSNSALFAMPSLFRLLYSTGMRVSEAISLKNKDINFDQHYIHLRETKNDHERLIPLCKSIEDVLIQYIDYRKKLKVRGMESSNHLFFVKTNGTKISHYSVGVYFHNVLEELGVVRTGRKEGPRVHDIRHTQAVHALAKMANEGIDIYTGLIYLSHSLGHLSVSSTNTYVRLTQAMYPEINKQLSSYHEAIYQKLINKSTNYELKNRFR